MKEELANSNDAHKRLETYLNSVPFPWPEDADLDHTAKRFAKDQDALALVGPKIKVQILSSFLIDYLVDHLILMFARRGLWADVRCGEFGALTSAILDENHDTYSNPPHLFLILPNHRDLLYSPEPGVGYKAANKAIKKEAIFWTGLLARLPAPAVQLSFDTPPLRPLGELDGFIPGGTTYHARGVNFQLAINLPPSCTLVDADSLAQTVGKSNWHDPHVYHLCKQPFSFSTLPHIANALSAAAIGLLGKARKVLVLDLDNTLWGGVIGDDGLEHIELGLETPEGEPFITFQHYLKNLRERGVILAACSKNCEEIARQPFKEHPAMVLKESDFACFVSNFDDKPVNIVRIAKTLNVGLDAIVFFDDNPIERALLRQELPEVLTIEVPNNPAYFSEAIESARIFPLSHLTEDDLNRAESYSSRALTTKTMSGVKDMDGFLTSLEPQVFIEKLSAGNIDRISQLVLKTNQFKLNPLIFSAKELYERPDEVIALRLTDRIQDYGIVSAAVLNTNLNGSQAITIENWVMSCRVFSRRLEYAMFELIIERALHAHAKAIHLEYAPSDRNGLIGKLLPALGFTSIQNSNSWILPLLNTGKDNVKTRSYPPHHIKIIRSNAN